MYTSTAEKYMTSGNPEIAVDYYSIAYSLSSIFPDLSHLSADLCGHLALIYRHTDNSLLSLYWTRLSNDEQQRAKWRKSFGISSAVVNTIAVDSSIKSANNSTRDRHVGSVSQTSVSLLSRPITIAALSLTIGIVIGWTIERGFIRRFQN